jgi:hypothetical protein
MGSRGLLKNQKAELHFVARHYMTQFRQKSTQARAEPAVHRCYSRISRLLKEPRRGVQRGESAPVRAEAPLRMERGGACGSVPPAPCACVPATPTNPMPAFLQWASDWRGDQVIT